jgi:hypothetical protein
MTQPADNTAQKLHLLNQQQLEEPKAPIGIYELPCGYIDPDSKELVNDVELKEITANEEDLLANEKIAEEKKLSELLVRCVTRLGKYRQSDEQYRDRLLDLTIGDRTYLIFCIRRVSLGDTYPFVQKCPACEVNQLFMLDLSELEVRKMADPMKRQYECKTPTGKTVKYHVMTGHDEALIAKFGKSGMDKVSLSVFARLDELNGAKVQKQPVAGKPKDLHLVKNLGLRDMEAIQMSFEENEGGVETSMDMSCPNCQHDFKQDLDVGQTGFFFPSRALRDWKKNSST